MKISTNNQLADKIDWKRLSEIRSDFLEGTAGNNDYWKSQDDLRNYNLTFAVRIGWKWDFVLNEAERLNWTPQTDTLIDVGCGSGIASRKFLERYSNTISKVILYDRSHLAMEFTRNSILELYPNIEVECVSVLPTTEQCAKSTVVVSHVLTELNKEQAEAYTHTIACAHDVLWCEPGTKDSANRLVFLREILRKRLRLIAPCPHQNECGMLSPVNHRHWCHFFAESDDSAFTTEEWSEFTAMTSIDLSDLPLSYLILTSRSNHTEVSQLPNHNKRLIARAHCTKHDAVLTLCSAEGVKDVILKKNVNAERFKELKKGESHSLIQIEVNGRAITSIK
jgi:ribosomal protein RSM22 (predicted rRNA methylase)